MLVCIEDLMQFSSLSADASSPSYYSVDSCCSINNISEMVTYFLSTVAIIYLFYAPC